MAILSFYQCEILVNGIPLPEYDDDDTEDTHDRTFSLVTKYVEATAGSEFAIRFSLLPECTMEGDLAWKISLDGSKSSGVVMEKAETLLRKCSKTRDGVTLGSGDEWYLRKYTFANLVLGENIGHLTAQEMKAKYSGLGTIRTELWRYNVHYLKSAQQRQTSYGEGNASTGAVPEKALKGQALSLSTGLGKPVRSQRVRSIVGSYTERLAAFEFKYRSREALQQLMILPPDIPLEEKRIEDLTAEEARELLRRQRAQSSKGGQVKSEQTTPNLKRERASTTTTNTRPLKISRASDGREYIDLASDSEDGNVKDEGRVLAKGTKDRDANIEVLDFID